MQSYFQVFPIEQSEHGKSLLNCLFNFTNFYPLCKDLFDLLLHKENNIYLKFYSDLLRIFKSKSCRGHGLK